MKYLLALNLFLFRQYQSNLASRRLRKEDNEISSSSEKLYSTLPRAKATRYQNFSIVVVEIKSI